MVPAARVWFRSFVASCLFAAWATSGLVLAAGKVELKEESTDSRTFQVTGGLEAKGKVYTRTSDGKASPRGMNVSYKFDYLERRLAGIGREAQSLRTIRNYEKAKAQIAIGEQVTFAQLRESVRTVIAAGQREGMNLYSLGGPFLFSELELIRIPGDSATLAALLPLEPVEPGDTWKPSEWVLQLLVGMEAVEKSSLECKFEALEGTLAKLTFSGEITGADRGAAANLKVTGSLQYDNAGKFISRFQLDIADKHSIGVVSPGLDVTATVTCERTVSTQQARGLSEAEVKLLPLEPPPGQLLLVFDIPEWGVRFHYERQWHLFQQVRDLAIFRLMEKGQPVTQLNAHRLVNAAAGVQVTLKQFESDVQTVMAKMFQKVLQSEQIPTSDGKIVYRVVVLGRVERPGTTTNDKGEKQQVVDLVPYQWIHYLVTAPDGRRLTFVFILEPKAADTLDGRDLSLVGGLEFFQPRRVQLQPAEEK